MVEIMSLDDNGTKGGEEDDATVDSTALRDVEIEIEDADGQVAKMSLGSDAPPAVRDAGGSIPGSA